MANSSGYIVKWSDNVARRATITVQSGMSSTDARYGPGALVDDNPAKVSKILTTSGAWVFNFSHVPLGSPPVYQTIKMIGLIHHNFDPTADVRIQGNDTSVTSWDTPLLDLSIPIPPWLAAGTERRWPVNPWLNINDALIHGGYSPTFLPAFPVWRVSIVGNSQPIQLGQIVLAQEYHDLDPDLQWKYQRTRIRPVVGSTTSYGVDNIADRGTNIWAYAGDHIPTPALEAYIDEHYVDAGGPSSPWLLVPNRLVNACHFVRYNDDRRTSAHEVPGAYSSKFNVREAARGLRPGI